MLKPFLIHTYRIFILISFSIFLSCEPEKESSIQIMAEFPETTKILNSDTLKFFINSEIPILRVDLKSDSIIYARFEENIIGKNATVFNPRFIFTPNKTGKNTMQLTVINKSFDTKEYKFTIEVTN